MPRRKKTFFVVNVVRQIVFFSFAVKRPPSNEQMRPEAGWWDGRRRWDSNPRGLFTLHDFQSCSLDHYETPPVGAERVGFEPTRACTLPLFESGTFDHSDISPPWSITYLSSCGKHCFFAVFPIAPGSRRDRLCCFTHSSGYPAGTACSCPGDHSYGLRGHDQGSLRRVDVQIKLFIGMIVSALTSSAGHEHDQAVPAEGSIVEILCLVGESIQIFVHLAVFKEPASEL
jgi:hypothetical protein